MRIIFLEGCFILIQVNLIATIFSCLMDSLLGVVMFGGLTIIVSSILLYAIMEENGN